VGDLRELGARGGLPIVDAPIHGGTKIEGNAFESREMDMTGSLGEF
jgi:hypothetical protein